MSSAPLPPWQPSSRALSMAPPTFAGTKGGFCTNSYDKNRLENRGQVYLERDTFFCGQKYGGDRKKGASCMQKKEFITPLCAQCFGISISCSWNFCEEECRCSPPPPGETSACYACVHYFCKPSLDACTGLPSSLSRTDTLFEDVASVALTNIVAV